MFVKWVTDNAKRQFIHREQQHDIPFRKTHHPDALMPPLGIHARCYASKEAANAVLRGYGGGAIGVGDFFVRALDTPGQHALVLGYQKSADQPSKVSALPATCECGLCGCSDVQKVHLGLWFSLWDLHLVEINALISTSAPSSSALFLFSLCESEVIFKPYTSHNEKHRPYVDFLKITSPLYSLCDFQLVRITRPHCEESRHLYAIVRRTVILLLL